MPVETMEIGDLVDVHVDDAVVEISDAQIENAYDFNAFRDVDFVDLTDIKLSVIVEFDVLCESFRRMEEELGTDGEIEVLGHSPADDGFLFMNVERADEIFVEEARDALFVFGIDAENDFGDAGLPCERLDLDERVVLDERGGDNAVLFHGFHDFPYFTFAEKRHHLRSS